MNTAYTQEQVATIKAAAIEANAEDDPSLFQGCLIDLMEGLGASEDHDLVKARLAKLPLSPVAVNLVHAVLVNSIKSITAQAAPAAGAVAGPNMEALRHSANEWADMAINGLQWLRNIVAGVSDAKTALENMESNLAHCRAVNDAPEVQAAIRAAAAPTPAAQADSQPAPDLQPLHNLLYLAQRQDSLAAMQRIVGEARLELAKVRDTTQKGDRQ